MRHLAPAFALGALRRGKQIEQFLGTIKNDHGSGLRWVSLCPGPAGVTICLSEVEDVGTGTFLDITEFPALDPDGEAWGRVIAVLPAPEEALRAAERELAADPERWVNESLVCDEYHDYRAVHRR